MFKIHTTAQDDPTYISMKDLKPLQLAKVVEGEYEGHIVMRTACTEPTEVMDLSDPTEDSCWTGDIPYYEVELLPKGTIITLEVV